MRYNKLASTVHTLSLTTLLRKAYTKPYRYCYLQYNQFSSTLATKTTALDDDVQSIAVLGGGITGLTSAYRLSQLFPNTAITLYEKNSRLGGWLHSTSVPLDTGEVVFEHGPRTLRPETPSAILTLRLIDELGMGDEVLMTPKDSAAAKNRFIYYPDHLVRMPGSNMSANDIFSFLSEPLMKGNFWDIPKEFFKDKNPSNLQDESVGSFLSRRFGTALVDNVVSAVFHGIYAGDIYQLSARSIIPKIYAYERFEDSILFGLMVEWSGYSRLVRKEDIYLERVTKELEEKSELISNIRSKASVYTFKKGLGQLAHRLEQELMRRPNMTIRRNLLTTGLKMMPSEKGTKIQLRCQSCKPKYETNTKEFSHVVSTIPPNHLRCSTIFTTALSPLVSPAVTVMVVNLFYRNPSLLPVHGFGYLIPRSIPLSQNPERALGVVFDSDAAPNQDAVPGTKVTVMLGGHWWDGWSPYPSSKESVEMAKTVLARHLNITEEPALVQACLQPECIPQYEVGHRGMMRRMHHALRHTFQGRLKVAGCSFTGVGVNDCVRAGIEVAESFGGNWKETTGLEKFVEEEEYVVLRDEDEKGGGMA